MDVAGPAAIEKTMAEVRQFEFNLDQLWAFSRGLTWLSTRTSVGGEGTEFPQGVAR